MSQTELEWSKWSNSIIGPKDLVTCFVIVSKPKSYFSLMARIHNSPYSFLQNALSRLLKTIALSFCQLLGIKNTKFFVPRALFHLINTHFML